MIREFQGTSNFIASFLEGKSSSSRFTIDRQDDGLEVRTEYNFRQLLPGWLAPFCNDTYADENRKTIEYFYEAFGEGRVKRISDRRNLDIVHKHSSGHSLTVGDVEELFLGMGLVTKDDMEAIFNALVHPDRETNYLHKSDEELADLRAQFRGKQFSDLTKADCDTLYDLASPFEKLETFFINDLPKPSIPGTRGHNLKQLRSLAYQVLQMRRAPYEKRLHCDYNLLRRVIGYHNPDGLVLPETKGYRYIFTKVTGGGAYKVLLKSMNKTQGLQNKVVCLPTHFFSPVPQWWEQVADILRPDLGIRGTMATYDQMKGYLYHPEEGFVDTAKERVEYAGFSLGAINAERDAVNFPDKISRLFAVGSSGLDEASLKTYKSRVMALSQPKMKVRYVFHSGSTDGRRVPDHISYMGAGFVGKGCPTWKVDVKIRDFLTIEGEDDGLPAIVPERIVKPTVTNEFMALVRFFISFGTTHTLNYLKGPFKVAKVHYPRDERLTNIPLGWEWMRQWWAKHFGQVGEAEQFLRMQEEKSRA